MSNDDLTAFREEMRRRGVYKSSRRVLFRSEPAQIRKAAERKSIDLAMLSLKQIAASFGTATPDSEVEIVLYRELVEKVRKILDARKEREGG